MYVCVGVGGCERKREREYMYICVCALCSVREGSAESVAVKLLKSAAIEMLICSQKMRCE